MRLKSAPRGGGQGLWRVDPDQSEGFLGSCVARGRGSPKLSVSTQPPLLAHRISLSPHVIGNLTPTQPPGLAWPGWILIEVVRSLVTPALPACLLVLYLSRAEGWWSGSDI